MKNIGVYLAGGMRTGWQDIVIESVNKGDENDDGHIAYPVTFYDPRSHGLHDPKDYTRWDIDAIDKSRIVFAHLDATNPSGIGMACEVGYSSAKGKYLIFTCENDEIRERRYWQFAYNLCHQVVVGLDKGIELLKQRIIKEYSAPMPYSL